MSTKIKRIISVVIVVILTFFLVQKLGYLLRPASSYDRTEQTVNAFEECSDDNIEVIGLGSSHMYNTLVPMDLYCDYGIGSFNSGTTGQSINTTLLLLRSIFNIASPKVVIIDTYKVNVLEINKNFDYEIYYTRLFKSLDGKVEYLKQAFGSDVERYVSYFFPIVALHENWTNLEKANFKPKNDFSKVLRTMGYLSSNKVTSIEIPDISDAEQKALDVDAYNVLKEIVELCKDNGAEVLFITVPYGEEYNYSDALNNFANENNCTYLNLFEYVDEIGLDGKTDFMNNGHLNKYGAEKVTHYLGEYLIEHYELTDFRDVSGNIWEKNLT